MPHLDLSYLRDHVTDDEEFINQLLEVFLQSSEEDMESLQKAVSSSQYEAIKRSAHKVKSSFRSLGMEKLTELLQRIEDAASQKRPMEEITTDFKALEDQYPQVRAEVKAILNG